MNQINPYRRNCEIMRKFFAKPIFLIIGIVFSVYITASAVLCLLSKQVPVFDFISTAMCVAFFVFYFKAHSKKDFVSFRAPTVLMDIVSIVGIVFSGLITVCSGLLSVLFLLPDGSPDINNSEITGILYSSIGKAIHDLLAVICPVVTVLGIIFLIYFIGMQRMTLSFKKSLSNIYLQRKGAVMFGVMSIILAIISIIYYTGLTTIPFMGVERFFTSLSQGINIPALVQGLLVTLILVLYAILGFMYNSYIKKLVNSIETSRPVQPLPDKEENVTNNNPTLNMWAESESFNQPHRQATVTRPVAFTPQAVFGGNRVVEHETKSSGIQIPENEMQNPYVRNSAPPTKRCANCGKENPNINIFCGNCGSKL